MKLTNGFMMYVQAFGKLYKVLSVCKSIEEANDFCSKHPEGAVICESNNDLVIVAEREATKTTA